MARLYSSISTDTTLSVTLTSGGTVATVADSAALLGGVTVNSPNTFTIVIDPDTASEEIVVVTAVAGNQLTVTRAQGGTSAIEHLNGATVRHVLTSIELTDFETVKSNYVTASSTTTFTNKTINANDNTFVGILTASSSDTLSNKSIALGSNTVTGTTSQFNTALTDGDFATLAGSETLTSKTIALGSNTVSGTLAEFNTAVTDNDITPANLTLNAQTGTTYTLVLTDATKLVTLDNGSAIAVTVPTNASVAFPSGSQINLVQKGAGQVTVSGDSGVTVNATPGAKTRAQWSAATLIKIDTDTWVLLGDLSA